MIRLQLSDQSLPNNINQKSMLIAITFLCLYLVVKVYRLVEQKLNEYGLIELDFDCIIFKNKILHFKPSEIELIKTLVDNTDGAEIQELLLSIGENSIYEIYTLPNLLSTMSRLNHMLRAITNSNEDVIFREKLPFDNGTYIYKIRYKLFRRSTKKLSSFEVTKKAPFSRLFDSNL